MAADSTLQSRIDAITYPPTHTYRLGPPLTPTGDLARRVAVIEREFPEFFQSEHLLDVGCNKGFFSLYHQGSVTGIDPSQECLDLCWKLMPRGVFFRRTFVQLHQGETFQKIWIGNGHHYPFIEAGGWGWVQKLDNICSGEVLLEGPVDMRGRDARRCIPDEIAHLFTLDQLLAAFDPYFRLIKKVPSPLVNRFFLHFERRIDK